MVDEVKKVVFPVGGMGTRFLPITSAIPKEMLPIVDRPLIEYAVREAYLSGINEFIFVTREDREILENYLNKLFKNNEISFLLESFSEDQNSCNSKQKNLSVSFVVQEQPLGLGHAIWCARERIGNEHFSVILPDELFLANTPCLKQILDIFYKQKGCVVGLNPIPIEQSQRYGIVDGQVVEDSVIKLSALIEKPDPENAPSNLALVGRYVLPPEIFKYLDLQQRGIGGEIQLTDAMANFLKVENIPFHGVILDGRRFDCGSKAGFVKANLAFGLEQEEQYSEIFHYIETMKTN